MIDLHDFGASWSNRNGGEILVTAGSVRLTLSAAVARAVHATLGKALDVPVRAAQLADAAPAREPERIAAMDRMIAESFRHRHGALIGAFPAKAKRLAAVTAALEACDAGTEIVVIGGIAFTLAEAEGMHEKLMSSALTIDGESDPGSYARHLRHMAAMRGDDGEGGAAQA